MGARRLSNEASHPFLDHPGPIPFAHRGGAGDHPENTMPAFAAAVAHGYRYVETDVQASADGVLVAFHDDRLDRVTDRTGLLRERSWAEIAVARVAGTEPIVRLEALLEAWPDLRLNIDVKDDGSVRPLVEVLRRRRDLDRVCVASFSHRRMRELRERLGRAACTSLAPREILALRAASLAPGRLPAGRRPAGAYCVQVPLRSCGIPLVDARIVAAAQRAGLAFHVWTVDDPALMNRMLDLGVDGLMTDRPAALRGVLEERGQWAGR